MAKIKLKTSKTAAKRFKITGSGKILRKKAYNNHMFFNKSHAQRRRLDQEEELFKGERKRIKRLLGLQ
jgi:large subunit ribosomal protein L35